MVVRESAFRLCEAIHMIEVNWNRSDGIQPDLDPEYEAIQAWLWIPSLYQLIEQSFKLLLRHRNHNSGRIHHLSKLYRRLDCDHQSMLSDAYGSYCDLHNYLPYEDLISFLQRADRGKNGETGYTTWRYLLIDGFPPQEDEIPKIHIGAMLEISIAASQIMEIEIIMGKKVSGIASVNLRLQTSLNNAFLSIAREYCSRDDIQARVRKKSGILAPIVCERIEYYRDLLSRNLLWAKDYMKSSTRLELSQENTAIMAAICKKMMKEHKHDFLHYIDRLEAGDLRLPDIPLC